jgi:GNAT superfamily N-acetyltransferase
MIGIIYFLKNNLPKINLGGMFPLDASIFLSIIQYTVLVLIVCYVVFMMYVKVKHNFWAIQPVFHSYDLHYWFKLPCIIEPGHCGKKYVNFNNTQYYSLDSLQNNPDQCNTFISHIKKHYLREKEASYIPNKTHVLSHFKPGASVFILYYLDSVLAGSITSRLVNSFVDDQHHRTFYVDYLCVHGDYRKKGVAPQLIETLSYYQRKHYKDVDVSLFKKENSSHWVISLVSYSTYFYEIDRWNLGNYREPVVRNGTAVLPVNQGNATLWLDFLKQQREKNLNNIENRILRKAKKTRKNAKNKCFIQSDDDVLLGQINLGVYMVYLLVQIGTNVPVACYIFKDSGTKYKMSNGEDTIGLEVQSCFKIDECDDDTFVDGFYHALFKVQQICEVFEKNEKTEKNEKNEKTSKIPKYQLLLFENISDNNIIRNNFLFNKKLCCGKMPTTFYYYNYATRSVKPEELVIIL